jgi:hypothetical protein
MTRALLATLLLWSASAAAAPPLLDPPTAKPTDHATAGEPAKREPASMSAAPDGLTGPDQDRVRMPPMTVTPDRPAPDRRPAYVGLGLVVMAAALWWNRRQRDRFDREDDRSRRPRRVRVRDVERDADADDLHAAARGDAPDAPDRQDV